MISCKRENNITKLANFQAGSYVTSDYLYDDPPIMYTSNGTVTDPQAIREFLVKHNAVDFISFNSYEMNSTNLIKVNFSSGFSFPSESSYNLNPKIKLTFNSPVTITSNNGVTHAQMIAITYSHSNDVASNDSFTVINLRVEDDSIPFYVLEQPISPDGGREVFYPDTAKHYYWDILNLFMGLPFYTIKCPVVEGQHIPDTSDIYKCFYHRLIPITYFNNKLMFPKFSSVLYTAFNDSLYVSKDSWNYIFPNKRTNLAVEIHKGDTMVIQNKSQELSKEQ